MLDKKLIKNIDVGLCIIVVLLSLISLAIISSATHSYTPNQGFILKRQVIVQAIAFILGIIMIILILFIDYNKLALIHKGLYIFSILLLLTVYIPGVGKEQYGARSWINLGPIDLQPSEIVKISFILSFAKFLEDKQNTFKTIKDLIPVGLYVLIPVLLILKEPDLGNALVFMVITLGMVFMSGLDYKILGKGILCGVVALPIVYKFLAPHQRVRIDAFLNPSDITLPGNYHVMQSKIAIGSGQFLGKGLYQGTWNNANFLPVPESDFIFGVFIEELGFIGGLILLILYFLFLYKMINISRNAKDIYGTLITVGITSMFAFQIFENIGMTMGVMPVTGVTLPFLSYGGSSLFTNMIAMGIVLNVGMRRQKIKF